MKGIKVGSKLVGEGHPCFIIAEIGMNHNGDINLAKRIIKASKEAGADAAKFQMFTAEKLVTKDAKTYGAVKGHLPKFQQEMYKKYELTEEQYTELKKYCDELDIVFFASVWDEENADMLERIGDALFKVSSMDITHLPLLEHIAKKNRPIILSTGMSTLDEVKEAVDTIKKYNDQIVLLHCVSSYPAKSEDVNIRAMVTLKDEFSLPVGFSDHTPDILTDIVAVSAGANAVEKHFTIDKKLPGVDHHLSFEPAEFKEMIDQIRLVEKMLGRPAKIVTASEEETRRMARRSIIARQDIKPGTTITEDMLVIKRPGTGMPPKMLPEIIGKKAKIIIKEDELIKEEQLE